MNATELAFVIGLVLGWVVCVALAILINAGVI